MKPRIFVGSSSESLPIANEIHATLQYDAEVTVWDQDIFNLSNSTLEDLQKALSEADFGIFVLSADDISIIRNKNHLVVRDNVIFELGMFIGRLGKNRVFFLIPQNESRLHLPSDLLGVNPGTYDNDRADGNLRSAVGPFCTQVRKAIKRVHLSQYNLGIKSAAYFQEFQNEFDTLFKTSSQLTLFFIHSRSWRENHHDALVEFLSNKKNKFTVFLPNILNAKLLDMFQKNFDDGKFMANLIKEAYNFFILLQKRFPNCKIKIYDFYPAYSFYKFDSNAIVAMYTTTPKKKNVPSFHIKQGTGFWEFLMDDLKILEKSKGLTAAHLQALK